MKTEFYPEAEKGSEVATELIGGHLQCWRVGGLCLGGV